MKKLLLFLGCYLSLSLLYAQNTEKVCFKIHSIVKQTESTCKVAIRFYNEQFTLPKSTKKATAYKRYESGDETSSLRIGTGTVKFSKEHTELYAKKDVQGNIIDINPNPFYIVTISKDRNYTFNLNDLVEVEVIPVKKVESIFFELTRNHIRLHSVEGQTLYIPKSINQSFNEASEQAYLKRLLKDIKYTAQEMRKQMDEPKILSGDLKGKGLFDIMEQSMTSDVRNFLRYIEVRPAKYRGHTWKISEIYATWLHEGSPMPK